MLINLFKKEKKTQIDKEHFIDLSTRPLIDDKDIENISNTGIFKKYKNEALEMANYGFTKLVINDKNWIELLNKTKNDFNKYIDFKKIRDGKLGPTRFQDSYKHLNAENVNKVANHTEIIEFLKIIYGRKPIPFQTLNFVNGTRQHFHSDAVHFHSVPAGFMCGVWIALEDINEDAGPLIYFPKSHRLPYLRAFDLGLSSKQIRETESPQKHFEEYWRKIVRDNNFEQKTYIAMKGEVFIWHANLLHGGSNVKNRCLTRWSQVTHYFFENCAYKTPLMEATDNRNSNDYWRKLEY